ncbi:MAG: prephenate dehydrogenase/arogenate dehydrogenase family protein [Candidatus Buchananbacteria bacterium]|nr:prephenate dehydrogenase/arogenate dehydrogenase family protein [Candidatus Buchananbacteria bacterium]
MINAIIGASGDMGKNLLTPLLKNLGEVRTVSRDASTQEWDQVWQADVIWLAIPRDEISKVLSGITLRPDQLVIDICSIKRRLAETVKQTGAASLSLHPLNGPRVPLNGQKWVMINADEVLSVNGNAQKIIHYLKEQGISFLPANSEDEHDFMIGVVLSMPELLTIVIDALISQYAKDCHQPTPDMAKLMEWAVPASNALFSSYVHSINSSAEWLRTDLITNAHGDLAASAAAAFEKLNHLTNQQVEEKIKHQHEVVARLPKLERQRIRQWIERWFVDSTQKVFSFHKNIPMKPKLNIQYLDSDKSKIFPVNQSGRVTVGIHGIAGCFTHESALRLAEELGINPAKLDLKFLVEAQRVIAAVVNGETDRGVFAMANSGSGAYVSSMHAMGSNQFDVLAIYGMEILQCLITDPSIKDVSEIKEVFGHPQAVSQCKRTFAEKYPDIKLTEGKDSDDTALCVKMIAEHQLPPTTATLASQEAARIYQLPIIEYGMHHDPFNTTTFLVIKKKE